MNNRREDRLRRGVPFALFATSYSPLFVLMVANQFIRNADHLKWGGITTSSIIIYFEHFFLATLLITISIAGFIGLRISLSRLNTAASKNGAPAIISDVRNRNNEAVSYISTYIIPFLFQSYTTLYETGSILALLLVTYSIYVNSTLILINPILSLRYSLYDIEFTDNNAVLPTSEQRRKTGLIIIKERHLEENDEILIKKIGNKIYFGVPTR